MPLKITQVEEAVSTSNAQMKNLRTQILVLNMQVESNEKAIISSINKLLSTSKTRVQGLEALRSLIGFCPTNIINENALLWINHCIVRYPGDHLTETKLIMIGLIVESAYSNQEFTKKFISDHINKVLDMCLTSCSNPHEIDAALSTLEVCMKRYASWFTSHKSRIEKYLENFLTCTNEENMKKAACCFHYLQQVGGAGVDGINHQTNFSSAFAKICATIHKLFDRLFENEPEIEQYVKPTEESFNFKELHLDSQSMLHFTTKCIINCIEFLKTMLLKGFPVAKEINPLDVLDLIRRGCTVHHCISRNKDYSLNDCHFSILLINLQTKMLDLLRICIIWFQSNLLPFSFTVSKILVDSFSRSRNCDCFKYNQVYQETVYKVLKQWFQLSKCNMKPQFQEKIIMDVLKDVQPIRDNVSLSVNVEINKIKSKKARKKAVQERIIGSNKTNTSLTERERYIGENRCIFALCLLKQILESSVLDLKANLLQELYCSVLGTLLELATGKATHLYTNIYCQINLYETLVAIYEQDSLPVYPPLQLTLQILNRGSNSKNRHISSICKSGISALEKLCQPVCPSLSIVEESEERPDIQFGTVVEEMVEEQIEIESLVGSIMETDDGIEDLKAPEGIKVTIEEAESVFEENTLDDVESVDIEVASVAGTKIESCEILLESTDSSEMLPQDRSQRVLEVKPVNTSGAKPLGEDESAGESTGINIETLSPTSPNFKETRLNNDPALKILDVQVIKQCLSEEVKETHQASCEINNSIDANPKKDANLNGRAVDVELKDDIVVFNAIEQFESPKKKIKLDDEIIRSGLVDIEDCVDEDIGDMFVDEIRDY